MKTTQTSRHPRSRRPGRAVEPGRPAPAAEGPGILGDPGHAVARPQGPGSGEGAAPTAPTTGRASSSTPPEVAVGAPAARRRGVPHGRRPGAAAGGAQDRHWPRPSRSPAPSTRRDSTAWSARLAATTRCWSSAATRRRRRRWPAASTMQAGRSRGRGSGRSGQTMNRIVLAYAGGLDTSVAVPWLAETYGAEVVCVTLDLGQGKDLAVGARAGALGRRPPRARPRRPRGVRAAVHPAGAPGRRRLRRPVPARHRAGPAAHREEARRDRPHRGRERHRPRLHRQGQRPGAHRGVGPRARCPACASSRPARESGMSRDARDRVRQAARHPGAVGRRQPVRDRREPLGPLDPARRPRGSVGRTAGRRLRADQGPAAVPGRAGVHRARSSSGACPSRSTASRCRSWTSSPASARSPATTASAGST